MGTGESKRIVILAWIWFSLAVYKLPAQDSISNVKACFDSRYFKSVLLDFKDVATGPLHWKKRDFIIGGSLIGITALSVTVDNDIRNFFQRNRDEEFDETVNYLFNPLGNLYGYAFVFTSYMDGLMMQNERSKAVAMKAIKALAINTIFVQTVKRISNRQRPYQQDDPDPDDSFNPFESNGHSSSFFSGHTSTAFCIASVYAHEYSEKKWVPYVAYGLAGTAGLARLYLDKHWSSDVLAGALFGYYIGRVIHKRNNWNVQAAPLTQNGKHGLSLWIALK